jgi:hypothetical protein
VRQADGSTRPTGGAVAARLVLCDLVEDTCFVEFDVDCDTDLILGYNWLRAHDLAFLYASDAICLCSELGCTSGHRVRLDLLYGLPPLRPRRCACRRLTPRRCSGLWASRSRSWTVPRSGLRRAAAVRPRSLHSRQRRRLHGRSVSPA